MNLGEINKGLIAFILIAILGAGGYLWYSMLYSPAVAEQATAKAAEQTAQDGLAAANAKLAAAQQAIDNAKQENGKTDDSVARVQLARKAVPPEKLLGDAAIVLIDLARRADVRTSFKAGGEGAEASVPEASATLNGATPVDLEFKAAGSYAEMMLFMRLVEDTVAEEDGKLYARDRLFNVVKLEIGTDDEEGAGASAGFAADGLESDTDANELVARPGEILFTVTVRMYTSSTDNAQSVGATVDAAAQPTDPNAAATDPNAAATDPNAAAGGTTDPNAAAGGTADPNATPATDTGAVPAAGGPAA